MTSDNSSRRPLWQSAPSWRSAEGWNRLDEAWARWAPWFVLLGALFYYSFYYRSGLNLSGEGGTVAVVAMRLLEGQRPIVDTFLGYNVMWFYPVAWLFDLFGPNYLVLRFFFFALCTITGLLAYRVVWKLTGSSLFATVVALIPVTIPGMMFRNYMGFLAMLNMWLLVETYILPRSSEWRRLGWMLGSGLGLGLTFLIRIDLGTFFLIIHLGCLLLYPLACADWRRRFAVAGVGCVLVFSGTTITHVPFLIHAQHRGYYADFTAQYVGWISLIRYQFFHRFSTPPPAAATPQEELEIADSIEVPPAAEEAMDRAVLPRTTVVVKSSEMSFYDKVFSWILHLPVLIGAIILIWGSLALLLALIRRRPEMKSRFWAVLLTLGSALTLFPQYFFFRPDTPHLSEFMVPFVPAMAVACAAALQATRMRRLPWRMAAGALALLCFVDTGLYFYHSIQKESSGALAARLKRSKLFHAENGVKVYLRGRELPEYQGLYETIMAHSGSEDYVVCFPYSPTINFMTNRRSYLHNLYQDNVVAGPGFADWAIDQIQKYQPAVIVVDNRDINKTEASRFRNWASPVYAYITANYRLAGTFLRHEVYVRSTPLQTDAD